MHLKVSHKSFVGLNDANVQVHEVPACSEQYDVHPRRFAFSKHGEFLPTGRGLDPITSGSHQEINDLNVQLNPDLQRRDLAFKKTLEDGAAWEHRTARLLEQWKKQTLRPEQLKAMKDAKGSRLEAKRVKQFEQVKGRGEALLGEEATLFRAIAARATDLALDRHDIGCATKELCRGFAIPSNADYFSLKHLCRCMVGKPRYVWHFAVEEDNPDETITFTDTYFAGCPWTKRSNSEGVVLRGCHPIKSHSKTQSTVCLSSAEAGLGGIATAAQISLEWPTGLRADASAAIGICSRRGVDKARHLHTAYLWVQDRLKTDCVALRKTPGDENIADVMTNYLGRPGVVEHVSAMNFCVEGGRAGLAPKTAEDIVQQDTAPASSERARRGPDKKRTVAGQKEQGKSLPTKLEGTEERPRLGKSKTTKRTEGVQPDKEEKTATEETKGAQPAKEAKAAEMGREWPLSTEAP